MPKRIIFKNKICAYCGKEFNRGRLACGREEGVEDFRKRKYCSHECFSKFNSGKNHWLWKGGIRRNKDGYLQYTSNDKFLHRKIVEDFIGRKLNNKEVIHHINGNVTDNRLINLKIMTNSEHRKLHCKEQLRNKKGCFCK